MSCAAALKLRPRGLRNTAAEPRRTRSPRAGAEPWSISATTSASPSDPDTTQSTGGSSSPGRRYQLSPGRASSGGTSSAQAASTRTVEPLAGTMRMPATSIA